MSSGRVRRRRWGSPVGVRRLSNARCSWPDSAYPSTRTRRHLIHGSRQLPRSETGALLREQVYAAEPARVPVRASDRQAAADAVLSRRTFSWLYGFSKRSRRSRDQIAAFIETLGVDTTEIEKPIEAYRSLDEFFSRRLRPGARPDRSESRSPVVAVRWTGTGMAASRRRATRRQGHAHNRRRDDRRPVAGR